MVLSLICTSVQLRAREKKFATLLTLWKEHAEIGFVYLGLFKLFAFSSMLNKMRYFGVWEGDEDFTKFNPFWLLGIDIVSSGKQGLMTLMLKVTVFLKN